ncbi:hypothetical protein L1987_62196 [Smallanthus sonchifolius]|uniref:Uncharacterized protein n=1 Tax=Smallanthus sonchifolius TaxID=185202 RepID=A0ACB9C9Z6_9ASTR|nr:hypothetical protein L1987_62196 [Smallanthus sonchifolius]
MRNHSPYLYSFLLLSYLMLSDCDTLYANQPIEDGKTIVSNQNLFELGFFSPGKSYNRYLGIWYKKISIGTVVWVANRETPITDRSGMFKVSSNGNLEILSRGNTMVWSSKSTVSRGNNSLVVVELLDTGNLVVWEIDKDNNTNKNLIWQSFDHPGDTLLPGMKFGKDLVTRLQRNVTSWKSPDDPSIGAQDLGRGTVWVCGPYGSCSINKRPPCTCVPGFEPRYPKEWDASDWSSGCKRKMSLNCGDTNGDGFRKITGIKLPDTRRTWYNASMTLGECEMACRMKCSCTAYADLDISNGGSGCLLCSYISPGYALYGRFSIKSDVFSFGVLLLEILSGKKNREFSQEDYSGNLLGHMIAQWRIMILYLYSSSLLLSLLLSDCAVSARLDALYANQPIKDGKTIVSNGNIFELGFFSPGKSKNRYLGIWYKRISICTVVWVANRETPITDKSGLFKVSRNGNLEILSGGNTMVWSSKSTVSRGNNNPVVELLDTGNLVVWEIDRDNNTNKNLIWQSFDHPGDMLLPGMKFGKDLVTGLERYVTSWKSPDDPSIGAHADILDTSGYPQIFGWQDQVLISRLGPWNGLGYSGVPIDKENPIYSSEFVVNEKEIYYKYELRSSVVQRVVLTWDGKTQILQWIERIQDWIVYGDLKVDNCDLYAICGPYGRCIINKHPPCTCLLGFEPRNPKEWNVSDWSSGCKRKTPLNCGKVKGDGFQKTRGVKVPDTRSSWYNASMTLGECEMACRMNCSCTAYANLNISNGGSGCLLWFDELMDIRDYDGDHNIYIKMVASELAVEGRQSDSNKRKRVVTTALSFTSAALLVCVVAYACRRRKKRLQIKDQGDMEYALDKKNKSVQAQLLGDIPFISLYKVVKATNNFSVSNKIGEGGFGPVYKGVLENGQEIDTSSAHTWNGLTFDISNCAYETRSSTLDWPQRFGIIHGTARGHDTIVKTKKVVGTYGYISPEYAVHGCFSIKSDVFSFGVLVLEIVSGKTTMTTFLDMHGDFINKAGRLNLFVHLYMALVWIRK